MSNLYKISRSHGFNPNNKKTSKKVTPEEEPAKACSTIVNSRIQCIETYALLKENVLNNQQQQNYQIVPDQNHKFICMFDQKQLISKSFQKVVQINKSFNKQKSQTTTTKTQPLFFFQQFTNSKALNNNKNNLIVYVSNENEKVSDQIILGQAVHFSQKRKQNKETQNLDKKKVEQNWNSILKICYQSMIKNKKQNTIIMLSIIGIQSENILYDQLNFQWIQDAKNQDIQPIPQIKKKRPSLKIYKQVPTMKGSQKNSIPIVSIKGKITAQNLTKQQINSLDDLFETLAHYHQIKNHISYLYNYDSYQLGQLYQLFEVQVDPEYGSIKNTLQNYSILKLNNYLINQQGPKRCTGLQSLQLRLGMLLKNYIVNQTIKNQDKLLNVELHQSKILFYLSSHFKASVDSSILLLNEIGRYKLLKQQIRNLTLNINCTPHDQNNFTYCKHYVQNKKWKKFVQENAKKINPNELSISSQTFKFEQKKKLNSKSLKLYRQSQKVKVKSFYYPTVSSSQRNTLKQFDRLIFGFQKRQQLRNQIQTKYRSQSQHNGLDFTQIELKDVTKLNQYFKNSSRKNQSHVSCDNDLQKQKQKNEKNLTSNIITGKKLLTHHEKWFSNLSSKLGEKILKTQKQSLAQEGVRTSSFKKSIVPMTIQQIYGIKNKKMSIRSINSEQKKSIQKQPIIHKKTQKSFRNQKNEEIDKINES